MKRTENWSTQTPRSLQVRDMLGILADLITDKLASTSQPSRPNQSPVAGHRLPQHVDRSADAITMLTALGLRL